MSTAAVRLLCGACGAAVGRADAVCPMCGARLEHPADTVGTVAVCPSCGHRNTSSGVACEACGALLASGTGARGGGVPREGRDRRKKPAAARAGRSTEPWMYVAGASLLVLIACVVALRSPSPSPASGSPAGVPQMGSVPSAGGGDHIAALEQAVHDRPGDPGALRELANGLHDHRDWERAIGIYAQYLQKNPDDPDARVDMGICYFELSQAGGEKGEEYFAKAVGEMETALRKSPGHVPAAFNLGVIHLQRGAVQESNDWFRRAVAMDRNHPLAQRAQRMLEQHSFSN